MSGLSDEERAKAGRILTCLRNDRAGTMVPMPWEPLHDLIAELVRARRLLAPNVPPKPPTDEELRRQVEVMGAALGKIVATSPYRKTRVPVLSRDEMYDVACNALVASQGVEPGR